MIGGSDVAYIAQTLLGCLCTLPESCDGAFLIMGHKLYAIAEVGMQ